MKKIFWPQIAVYAVLCACLLCPGNAAALEGKVIKIADGDTITILTDDHRQERIRLYGIDCPERRQPFGNRAKEFTTKELAGKIAQVDEKGKDRYGRIVGIVKSGSESINEKLLENGFAWVYDKYCKIPQCSKWKNIESNARKNKIGLWHDKEPISPWNWRKMKK